MFYRIVDPRFCFAEIRHLIMLFDILLPQTKLNKYHQRFKVYRVTQG